MNSPLDPSDFMDRLRRQQPHPKSATGPQPETGSLPKDQADSPPTPKEKSPMSQDNADASEPNGILPPDARRGVVFLLRQGVVLHSLKPRLFETICRYEKQIRAYLCQIYLKLILDEKYGLAFVAGMDNAQVQDLETDGEDVLGTTVSLIPRRRLSLYDTFLLLVLRKHYQTREKCGEQKIVIDIEKIESDLSPFLPLSNNQRGDKKRLNGALKKMITHKILTTIRGNENRFEITPVIRYVVSAEFLEATLKEYTRLAGEVNGPPTARETESNPRGKNRDTNGENPNETQ